MKEHIDTILRWFPAGVVAIDLEMTGLSSCSDHIIEIAAAKLTGMERFTNSANWWIRRFTSPLYQPRYMALQMIWLKICQLLIRFYLSGQNSLRHYLLSLIMLALILALLSWRSINLPCPSPPMTSMTHAYYREFYIIRKRPRKMRDP